MASVTGRDFFDLVKAIGESKSKQEEDRIIAEEVRNTIFIHQKVISNMCHSYTTDGIILFCSVLLHTSSSSHG